jgi:predicted RecB family nuclease
MKTPRIAGPFGSVGTIRTAAVVLPYASGMLTFSQIPPGEPLAVSATLFVTYRRCPQQALGRLRGAYAPPTRATFRGALAHRLFARHIVDGPIADHDLAIVCRQETGANLNGQLAAVGLRPSQFNAVVEEVSDLYRRFAALPLDGVDQVEVSFEDDVSDDVALRGRIDAVFADAQGSRIVDWKTGNDLGDDVDAQLGFYALAWMKRTGSLPAAIEALSISTGERKVATPTADDAASIEDEVARMVTELRRAMVDGDDLERSAGPHCRWCPLLEGCAEGAAAVAVLD